MRTLLAILLVVWMGVYVASFIIPWTYNATGDGFTRGLNRIAAFFGWQIAAGVIGLVIWGMGRHQGGSTVMRWLMRIPVLLAAALAVLSVGVILWANLSKPPSGGYVPPDSSKTTAPPSVETQAAATALAPNTDPSDAPTPTQVLRVKAPPAAAAPGFHTDPSCWDTPRVFHTGPPSEALAQRVERTANVTREPRDNSVVSPNGAYKVWVELPNSPVGSVADQVLYVYSEQGRVTRFYLAQSLFPLDPRWINEKLVFVRVPWGRVAFTDLVINAENGDVLYQEEARAGQDAYVQYQQACGNTCPCDPNALTDIAPPVSAPRDGQVIGYLQLNGVLNRNVDRGVAVVPGTGKSPLPVFVEANGTKVEIVKIADPDQIVTDNHDEWRSALVYAREPDWFKIGLTGQGKRKVWVREADAGSYKTMPEILTGQLAFLGEHWDGRLWASPDGEGGYLHTAIKNPGLQRQEYSSTFTELRETDSGPWLKVQLHESDPCEGGEISVAAVGWVPAWSQDGRLVGGYHPRGC